MTPIEKGSFEKGGKSWTHQLTSETGFQPGETSGPSGFRALLPSAAVCCRLKDVDKIIHRGHLIVLSGNIRQGYLPRDKRRSSLSFSRLLLKQKTHRRWSPVREKERNSLRSLSFVSRSLILFRFEQNKLFHFQTVARSAVTFEARAFFIFNGCAEGKRSSERSASN